MRPEDSSTPQGWFPANRNGGYERRDANVRGLFATVLFLGIAGVIIHFVLAGLVGHWNKAPAPTDAWNPPKPATTIAITRFNWPRLQVAPVADLQTFRIGEETQLNTYGWINKTSGTVHIPIERAMDLLVSKGMPDWGATNMTGPSPLQLQQQRRNQEQRLR